MSQQPRPAWARLPFMARVSLNPPPPAPVAQPDPTPAPPPIQQRALFGPLARTPALPSQPQEPTPPSPPPPAVTPAPPPSPPPPAPAPPALASSPPRSTVAPPVPIAQPAPTPVPPPIQAPQPRAPFRQLARTPAVPSQLSQPREPTPPPPAPAAAPPAPPPSPPPPAAAPPALASSPPRSTVAPPVPIAQPAPTPVSPPIQPPQPRAPFRQLARTPAVPSQLSQPREPTPPPPPPPAASPAPPPSPPPPAAAPPALARSPLRSPIAPQVPAPSTPRRSPISAPPPLPPQENTTSAALKSPIINTLRNSPAPKEPLTTSTKLRVPSSPIRESPKTTTQATSSSTPASPVPKPVATAASESSPKIVKPLEKTPVQSPKPKSVAFPPSPFALPPSQIKSDSERESKIPTKVDQKDVLVQETIEKSPKLIPPNSHNSSIASSGRQELPKEKIPNKKISDSEKLGMSVITLSGENKGAVMEISPSRNKNRSITNPHSLHKNGNYAKLWSEGEKSSSDEEGRSNKEKNKKAMVMQSPPMTAYVNSNVQGVNNSIIFNGSSNHQNPGVHLSINRKANGGHGIHPKDHHA